MSTTKRHNPVFRGSPTHSSVGSTIDAPRVTGTQRSLRAVHASALLKSGDRARDQSPQANSGKPTGSARLGIHFAPLTMRQQAPLDRLMFALMRAEARARRHLRVLPEEREEPEQRRRRYHRVSAEVAAVDGTMGPIRVVISTPARGPNEPATQLLGTLIDLSCGGCSVACEGSIVWERDTPVVVQLIGDNLNLTLDGKVAHITKSL